MSGDPGAAYSSEALREVPQFQEVTCKKFLIVTGEEGLAVLAPALRARGAEVEMAEVYRRVPLPYDEERVLSAGPYSARNAARTWRGRGR